MLTNKVKELFSKEIYDESPAYDAVINTLSGSLIYEAMAVAVFHGNLSAAEKIADVHGDVSRFCNKDNILSAEKNLWSESSLQLLDWHEEDAFRVLLDKIPQWGLGWLIDQEAPYSTTILNTNSWPAIEKSGIYNAPSFGGDIPTISDNGLQLENPEILIAFNEKRQAGNGVNFSHLPCWVPDGLVADLPVEDQFEAVSSVLVETRESSEKLYLDPVKQRDVVLDLIKKGATIGPVELRARSIREAAKNNLEHFHLELTVGSFLTERQKLGQDFPEGKTLCWMRRADLLQMEAVSPSEDKMQKAMAFADKYINYTLLPTEHVNFTLPYHAHGLELDVSINKRIYSIEIMNRFTDAPDIKGVIDEKIIQQSLQNRNFHGSDDLYALARINMATADNPVIKIPSDGVDKLVSLGRLPAMLNPTVEYAPKTVSANINNRIHFIKNESKSVTKLLDLGLSSHEIGIKTSNIPVLLDAYEKTSDYSKHVLIAGYLKWVGIEKTMQECGSAKRWSTAKQFFSEEEIRSKMKDAPHYVRSQSLCEDLGL